MSSNQNGEHLKELEVTGCTLLRDIKKNTIVDIYGVVTKFKLPTKTRGQDFVCSISVADPSRGMGQMGDTSINLFHHNSQTLPQFRGTGDIFVLRRARVQAFQNKLQCVSIKSNTTWAIIPSRPSGKDPSNEIVPVNIPGMVLSLDEKDYHVIRILQDWLQTMPSSGNTFATLAPQPSGNNSTTFQFPGKMLRTISQINRPGLFSDLVAEVVGHYSDTERKTTQLLVVDYTTNELLVDQEISRFGVAGRRVIMCTLFDEHHQYCPKVNTGSFVFIRNANSKLDMNQCLELRVHGDRDRKLMNPGVRLLARDDPRLVPLLEKRHEYMSSIQQLPKKSTLQLNSDSSQQRVWTVTKHKDINITPLSTVVASKMANKFRVRACVIDYKPKIIKDMVRPWCSRCQKSCSPCENPNMSCTFCMAKITVYKYQFACLLQDAHGVQLPVIFYDKDAEMFLCNSAPSNLYLEDYAASELKEQIDTICPAGKSSNVWLDFCIQSYMVDIDGQKDRRFRVFDTELKIH
ncbi:hypothetical protein K450DRAFT_267368 [Umbelopsis ramanniana AG]|uniref:Protection of telomeres protein 1 n=1 Tax=Umbelopsis ramanniana AG TaxID=1314678 RepID=A0AAD5HHI9_UMBRA|nr:uncharacterized protein K450DRAFT_267368 [Umbelopsis ramanniana AG]KAI8584717.1 hypothetical protein K450DRAFT_267368 [Umbelopsis ramanniana AG]